jgi:hypothetical protein
MAAFATWAEAAEPEVTCAHCGWTAVLGDWQSEWPSAVGGPTIKFNNWPELAQDFLSDLQSRLGGRAEIVRAHY